MRMRYCVQCVFNDDKKLRSIHFMKSLIVALTYTETGRFFKMTESETPRPTANMVLC